MRAAGFDYQEPIHWFTVIVCLLACLLRSNGCGFVLYQAIAHGLNSHNLFITQNGIRSIHQK